MAPNGTSRKTPSATGSTSSRPIKKEEALPLDGLFDDVEEASGEEKEVAPIKVNLKKPGNWDSEPLEVNGTTKTSKPPSPLPMSKLPPAVSKAFPTNHPMADKPEILKCNHCKRAVAKHAMPKHIEACLNKKQEKQRKKKEAKDARDAAARRERNGTVGDSDEEDDEVGGVGKGGDSAGSKKRKAGEVEDDGVGGAAGGPAKKKKKKDDGKAKAPRPKAPVDVEKQCGVELPQGGQCARSLTCKSHSMGAKRAVPGRSAPYDKLLLEYQRKNQAKLQKAQFDASAPNPDDELLPTGPVDSEEEKDVVMNAISRNWGGRPLYENVQVPLRGKYKYNRVRGMIAGAIGGGGRGGLFGGGGAGGGFFGGGGGAFGNAGAAPTVDEQGFVHARRGSVVPGARSMMAPAGGGGGGIGAGSRKASMAASAS